MGEQSNMAVRGFHHITAMAGDAEANIDFYTRILGLRLVKVTVNYDDPTMYHLYYGDHLGSPGSIVTFFPLGDSTSVPSESGITAFTLRIPGGTLPAWQKRFETHGIACVMVNDALGDMLAFRDESNHLLRLWAEGSPLPSQRVVSDSTVPAGEQITEVIGAEFTVQDTEPTAALLERLGFENENNNRFRLKDGGQPFLDVVSTGMESRRHSDFRSGSIHHLAFSVANDAEQVAWQKNLAAYGTAVTNVKDRSYFRSIYLREPGGIVLELATPTPGFTHDEPLNALGQKLVLPARYEARREEIVARLPVLKGVQSSS